MDKLLVIGGSMSQYPTIVEAKNMRIKTIVVDGNPDALCKDLADVFEVVDIKDLDKVLDIARKHGIEAVIVPGTDFPVTGAYVAEQMNLPGTTIEASKTCSNKILQRKKLKDNHFLVPRFTSLEKNSLSSLENTTTGLSFPLVVKPVDNMAARGIKKIYNYMELFEASKKAFVFSRSNKIVIEEFMSGMEFSIDALVHKGEVIIFAFADRHFALDPYFIEIGHTMPTILQKETRKEIEEEFIRAVKVLGIYNGAAKGDVKLTNKGIMIGEIAARISGGFLSGWTVPYAYGTNPHKSLIEIAFGKEPSSLEPKFYDWSAERVLLSIPGKVSQIIDEHDREILKLMFLHVKEGDKVFFPVHNAERCGSAISKSWDREIAINDAKRAVKDVFIRLEPNNNETDKFLFGKHYFHNFRDFKMFEPGKNEVDWHEIDLQEALYKVRYYTGKGIPKDKNFWKAFYKGSVQGGVYYIDSK